jgi:hypothetical protein
MVRPLLTLSRRGEFMAINQAQMAELASLYGRPPFFEFFFVIAMMFCVAQGLNA